MKSFLKIILAIFGGIIAFNGFALFFVSNVNLGNFLSVLLGGIIIFVTLILHQFECMTCDEELMCPVFGTVAINILIFHVLYHRHWKYC